MTDHDLASERVDYVGDHLIETAVPADPFLLFGVWLREAFAARDRGEMAEPTAMAVATSVEGRPKVRTVLLKELRDDGFTFFTNYDSAKGREITANPAVSLHFGWHAVHRQVRVEGEAEKVPREESEGYFATRPRGSQLGAWTSAQSSPVASLAELQVSYAAAEERFAGSAVPCPDHWGGYLVRPHLIEFWQGQPSRMHDRLVYRLRGDGGGGATGEIGSTGEIGWTITRLAP